MKMEDKASIMASHRGRLDEGVDVDRETLRCASNSEHHLRAN